MSHFFSILEPWTALFFLGPRSPKRRTMPCLKTKYNRHICIQVLRTGHEPIMGSLDRNTNRSWNPSENFVVETLRINRRMINCFPNVSPFTHASHISYANKMFLKMFRKHFLFLKCCNYTRTSIQLPASRLTSAG